MNYRLSLLLNTVPLSRAVKHIVRAIAKHTNAHDESPIAWVNQQTLAEEESMSRSAVARNIKKALELDVIIVQKQFHKNGRQKCNIYQVNLIKLYELSGQKQYSDQLPVTESEITDLPEMEDIVSYVERQDRETKDKLIDDTYSAKREELYNKVPLFPNCRPSKEKRLYIKNISPPVNKKRSVGPLPDEPIRTSDPQLIAHCIEQMRSSILKRL